MQKILIFDNKFNSESISSLSTIDKSIQFFQYNPNYSLNDNYDIVQPSLIIVNTFLFNNINSNNCPGNLKTYFANYLIPNTIPNYQINTDNSKSILITESNDLQNTLPKHIKYNNTYLPIYSLYPINKPYHYQYTGYINSCKDLYDLLTNNRFIFTTTKLINKICDTLNISYTLFKSKEILRINESKKILSKNLIDNQYILKNILCHN